MKLRKFLFKVCLFLAVVAGIWCLAAGYLYKKMNYKVVFAVSGEPLKAKGVTNILLIGNDSRTAGEDGRSDAMILLSISDKTKTIHMTSLLRDMYVDIPGYDGNRLNAAYSFGGAELLMETVEANLDVEVNRFVQVNFQAFADVVDAVGGVDLEVTNEEVLLINGYLDEYNMLENRPHGTDYLAANLQGVIHLNGPQALAYCRNRYIGTDFGRTERQRKVLSAMVKRAPWVVAHIDKVPDVFENVTTNLSQAEFTWLTAQVVKLAAYEMVQGSIPQEGTYSNANIRGMSVLDVDFKANNQYIREKIYGQSAQ